MSRFCGTVSLIALTGQAFAQFAAVSNACSSTIYAALPLKTYEALSPGNIRLDPILEDPAGTFTMVSPSAEFGSPMMALEYAVRSGTLEYDVDVENGNPFGSQGFSIGTANPSCPAGDCAPNAQDCTCVYYNNSDFPCRCPAANNSVTLTVCSG